MMWETNVNTDLFLLIGIVVMLVVIPVLVGLIIFINDFSAELKYLNIEIGRTTGAERRRYIH